LQSENQNSLYRVLEGVVPVKILNSKNKKKNWKYGHDSKYDIIVISKDGTLGDIYLIEGIKIGLPLAPKKCLQRHSQPKSQYWEREDYPKELSRIQSIFQWNEMPADFKGRWVDYIEGEFDRRENGLWFKNNGVPTYITGGHYMYLQWTKIDVGYPDYREANRLLYIFWEACKADIRCFGLDYLKIRRSGFSFMASSETVNTGTLAKDRRLGILSKTGADAKKMFTDKVVPINSNYPFFFKPIMDGMDKPKTELAYRVPASKITKNNMHDVANDDIEGWILRLIGRTLTTTRMMVRSSYCLCMMRVVSG